MKRLWTIPILALALVGCGGGDKHPETDVAEQPWEVRLESDLDTVVVTNEDPVLLAQDSLATMPEAPPAAPPPVPDPADFTQGWRVQLFASSSLEIADRKAKEFSTQFTDVVYLEYEPPFYKVRAGDFLAKADAEAYRDQLIGRGWDGAWVAETLVLMPR